MRTSPGHFHETSPVTSIHRRGRRGPRFFPHFSLIHGITRGHYHLRACLMLSRPLVVPPRHQSCTTLHDFVPRNTPRESARLPQSCCSSHRIEASNSSSWNHGPNPLPCSPRHQSFMTCIVSVYFHFIPCTPSAQNYVCKDAFLISDR
jgi:hypothetical protein